MNTTEVALIAKWNTERVKLFRKMIGVSQGEFCRMLDVSQACMSKYESGRKVPIEIVRKLEGISAAWKVRRLDDLQREMEFIKTF